MCLAGLTDAAAPAVAWAPPQAEQARYFDAMLKAAQGPGQEPLDRGYPEARVQAAAKRPAPAAPVFTACAPLVPPPAEVPAEAPVVRAPADAAKDNHALDKTKLCKFFVKGQCRRGSACSFAHGRRQLRPQPDFFRTQLCMDLMNGGSCSFGATCRYAHSEEELRIPDLKPGKAPAAKRAPAAAPRRPAEAGQSAEELARELETVQQQAQYLQAQLLVLQGAGAERQPGKEGRPEPPAPLEVEVPDHSSEASTSPGLSRHISLATGSTPTGWMCSEDAATWEGCSSAGSEGAEPLVDVVVRVRNTFVDMALAPTPLERAPRRAASAPRHLS